MKEKIYILSALLKGAHFLFPNSLRAITSLSLIFFLTAVPFVSSCSGESNAASPNGTGSPAASQGYYIKVTSIGNQTANLTIDDLSKLEQVNVRNLDHDCNGPRLTAVLKRAGIDEFTEVKIGGVNRGRVATAELTLNKSQITDNTVLDITNRGTSKFTDPVVPFEQWIYDVTDIDVK